MAHFKIYILSILIILWGFRHSGCYHSLSILIILDVPSLTHSASTRHASVTHTHLTLLPPTTLITPCYAHTSYTTPFCHTHYSILPVTHTHLTLLPPATPITPPSGYTHTHLTLLPSATPISPPSLLHTQILHFLPSATGLS